MEIEKSKRNFLIVLVLLDLLYLFFEIALNASVLELASGLVITKDKIETIENFGRTLSGVGLSLTIFALIKLPRGAFAKFASLVLICAVSIPTMHKIQDYIVDELVVAQSSAKARGNAELIVTYRDGLTMGVKGLGKDIPFDQSNPTQPEELAMTSIFALSIFTDYSANILRDGYGYFSEIKLSETEDNARKIYPYYKEVSDKLMKAMELNNEMARSKSGAYPASVTKVANKTFLELKKVSDATYKEIKEKQAELYNVALARNNRSEKGTQRLFSSCMKYDDTFKCSRIIRDIEYVLGIKDVHWMSGNRDSIRKHLCKGGCPKSNKQFLDKMLQDEGISNELELRYGVPTVIPDNPEEFMASKKFFNMSISEFSSKMGLGLDKTFEFGKYCNDNSDYYRYGKSYSHIKKCLSNFIVENKLASGSQKIELPSYLSGKTIYTVSSLLKHPEVVSMYKEMMSHYYIPIKSLTLSESAFVAQFYIPNNKARIEKSMENLAMNNQRDFSSGGSREYEGEMYIKALYVPPIALLFSLFFTLTTIARVCGRLFTIAFYDRPKVKRASLAVTVVMISSVIFVPIYVLGNKFTQESSIQRLESLRGEKFTAKQEMAVKWGLVAQPLIYEVGEPIIRTLGLERDR